MSQITVGGVVLVVALSASGAYAQGPAAKPKMKGAAGPIVAAGASFAEPKGWTRVQPPQAKTIGWFVEPGASSADAKRMILIDFGRPADPDARASAEGLAKQWGGVVAKEPVQLDGATGYMIRAENRGAGLKPVVGIVVHRGGRAYMLMGGAAPGKSVADEFEQVRKGWKWVGGK